MTAPTMNYNYKRQDELIKDQLIAVVSDQTCAEPVTYIVLKDGSVWASALIELRGDDRDDLEVLYAELPTSTTNQGVFPSRACHNDLDVEKVREDAIELETKTGLAHEVDLWIAEIL